MYRFKNRRASSQRWVELNPILLDGEIGIEADTDFFKFGDGFSRWTELTYFKNADATQALISVMIADALTGGLPGGPELSAGVEFHQTVPAASWIFQVPLGFNRVPAVSVYVNDEKVITDISADSSMVTVTFPSPTVGIAVLT